MQSAPHGGERIPYLCLIYHTRHPKHTHTHTHKRTCTHTLMPSKHTVQAYGKTDTHGYLQLTYLLQHPFVCKKSHAHTHICTLLHNTCPHTRTLITHNPPTQKLRRVFPWCRIKELTLPSPHFLLPLASCTSELGNTGSWAPHRARPRARIHYVDRVYPEHSLQALRHNITNTCTIYMHTVCVGLLPLPKNNFLQNTPLSAQRQYLVT